MKHRHPVVETTTLYYDVYTVLHEFSASGGHRLSIVENMKVGQWVTYGDIATLKCDDVLFAATTEYFHLELPEVFVVHSLKEHYLGEGAEAPNPTKALTMREKAALRNGKPSEGSL